MKVTLYPTHNAPKTVVVSSFADIQKLVGGRIEIAKETSMGDLLFGVNEDYKPISTTLNKHYPNLYGEVVLAPKGWRHDLMGTDITHVVGSLLD